jgi:hypothetical protein
MKRQADDLRRAAAEVLTGLADLTGDARFRRAAGIVKGRCAGRPKHDDDDALALVRHLLETRAARSCRAACSLAAAMFCARSHQVPAMRDRLQRKLRQK